MTLIILTFQEATPFNIHDPVAFPVILTQDQFILQVYW